MDKSITQNPLIYLSADSRAKLYTITAGTAEQVRERTRLWTSIKTGR
jgi:putrescine transport system substrate-binding protein